MLVKNSLSRKLHSTMVTISNSFSWHMWDIYSVHSNYLSLAEFSADSNHLSLAEFPRAMSKGN